MTDQDEKPWLEEVPADKDEDGLFNKYRPQLIAVGAVVVLAFVGLIFYAYQSGKDSGPVQVPVVRGPEGPAKQKPAEPGGMEVPDRDKLVYNRVSGEEEDGEVTLEAGPELPAEPPAAEAEPEPVAEAPAEEAVAEAEPVVAAEPEPAPAPAPEPEPAPAVMEGNFVIQLGAYGSRDSANRAWNTLQEKHGSVLGGLVPDLEPLKRAGGTLYRLRAGYFTDRDGADGACGELKARGQDCFPAER